MNFLRTEYAALSGMVLILLATVKHAFEVYTAVMIDGTAPSTLEMIYIAVMLIAIDYAVLLFTIHGNRYAAQTFAFMIFLVNLYAFWEHQQWPGWNAELFGYFPGFLFSCMYAYGLYYFTDIFSELIDQELRYRESQDKLIEVNEKLSVQQEKVSFLEEKLSQAISDKEKAEAALAKAGEQQENTLRIQEKARQLEEIALYLAEKENFLQKTPQALKKGVEYWQKKQAQEPLFKENLLKLLMYEVALREVGA